MRNEPNRSLTGIIYRRRHVSRGFTLLEILIAFVILGLATGAVMSIFGSSLVRMTHNKNQRLAVLAAQSVLDRVGTDIPLESGTQKGDMPGGIRWFMSVKSYEDTANETSSDETPPVTKAYLVAIRAAAGPPSDASVADLVSLRLQTGSVP